MSAKTEINAYIWIYIDIYSKQCENLSWLNSLCVSSIYFCQRDPCYTGQFTLRKRLYAIFPHVTSKCESTTLTSAERPHKQSLSGELPNSSIPWLLCWNPRVWLASNIQRTALEGLWPAVVRCAAMLVLLPMGSNMKLAAGTVALISWWSLCRMILSVELPGGMLQAAGHAGEQGTCLGKSHHGQTLVLLWFHTWAFLYWRLKGNLSQIWLQDASVLRGVKHHSLLWLQRRGHWSLLLRDVVTKLHKISKASQDLETSSNQQPPHYHPISSKNNDYNESYFMPRITEWCGLERISEGHLIPTPLSLVEHLSLDLILSSCCGLHVNPCLFF